MILPLPIPRIVAQIARGGFLGLASVAFLSAPTAAAPDPAPAKQKPAAETKSKDTKERAESKKEKEKEKDKKPEKKKEAVSGAVKEEKSRTGKEKDVKDKNGLAARAPVPVGTYGDWSAMTAPGQGKDKTCYALAMPKDRQPAKLQRDPAYVFISTRPSEGVRNEVALIMGFPLKENGAATADIDGDSFELVAKGANAWVKNPAKEKAFVDALRSGEKLIVKAASVKGNVTTDTYSLRGLSQALDRVQKECP